MKNSTKLIIGGGAILGLWLLLRKRGQAPVLMPESTPSGEPATSKQIVSSKSQSVSEPQYAPEYDPYGRSQYTPVTSISSPTPIVKSTGDEVKEDYIPQPNGTKISISPPDLHPTPIPSPPPPPEYPPPTPYPSQVMPISPHISDVTTQYPGSGGSASISRIDQSQISLPGIPSPSTPPDTSLIRIPSNLNLSFSNRKSGASSLSPYHVTTGSPVQSGVPIGYPGTSLVSQY